MPDTTYYFRYTLQMFLLFPSGNGPTRAGTIEFGGTLSDYEGIRADFFVRNVPSPGSAAPLFATGAWMLSRRRRAC